MFNIISNTSNHKGTPPKIAWMSINITKMKGLQFRKILQFKFSSKITKTEFTNLNGFQRFTIQYVEWFRFIISFTDLCLGKWISADSDRFQSIQSFDFEWFHWSKTIITDFDRFDLSKSWEIKHCVINIITSPIRNENRSSCWINRKNSINIMCYCWKELRKFTMDI